MEELLSLTVPLNQLLQCVFAEKFYGIFALQKFLTFFCRKKLWHLCINTSEISRLVNQ